MTLIMPAIPRWVLVVFVLWTLAAGCSSRTTTGPTSDGSVPDAVADTDGSDPSKELFDPTKIVAIEIQMDPADWDFVRTQERSDIGSNLFGSDCLSEAWINPYIYKTATVTVNGQTVNNVGVRKKGFIGSVNSTKPSLKVKFDEFVVSQELSGLDRLTLNNNVQNPAFICQCLTYDLFRAAGLPASRCNFATVKVNGQDLGLYSNIESMKKKFLARNFSDNDGNLYEGTLSDFRDEWMATWEAKTQTTDPEFSDILAVKAALAQPDDTVLAALEKLIDLDSFYTHWALEVLTNHVDGYANGTNNFFVYKDPASQKLVFMTWGTDGAFSASYGKLPPGAPEDVYAASALSHRLYLLPAAQAKYVDAMRTLLSGVWDETRLTAEIDRMEALIGTLAQNDPFFNGGGDGGKDGKSGKEFDFAASVQAVRDFVTGRRAKILPVIDSPPAWTLPMRSKPCENATAPTSTTQGTGSFSTTYGTLDSSDPFAAGSGTFEVTQDEKPITVLKVGAEAGVNPKTPGRVVVNVVAQLSAIESLIASFSIPDAAFVAGGSVTLDQSSAELSGALWQHDSSYGKLWVVGTLTSGSLTLTQASSIAGEAVHGAFTARWSSSTTTK